jgi:hypothetical protein
MRNHDLNKPKERTSENLKDWLINYGGDSMNKYKELEKHNFNKPLVFKSKESLL